MIVSLYSFLPLPDNLRKDFELPVFPYDDEDFEEFANYLKQFKVFRYEDDIFEYDGQDVSGCINFKTEAIDYPYFPVYYNRVALTNDELTVMDWPRRAKNPSDQRRGDELAKIIDAHEVLKDNKAWLYWNNPGTLVSWDDQNIIFEPRYELIDSQGTESECTKATLK